ncbi:thiamine phosphate synthase [Stakelama sp. CBK3Z-3]|uniref:Thiamine phosphate synthase n=1 Tax=Stakelama flava TaxID=2860338 RepID=A0ABS6XKH8_9SPHN|nr:thiamine phosphate synthase [Stakelama flava]MBW4330708.1 thiamine phosphate synthase [Stakelama flava]
MRYRHPARLPRTWLMTDERLGDSLWTALAALPRGSGVVFRHYSLPVCQRRALFAQISRFARRRGLLLLRAGDTPLGRGEDGVHNARAPHGAIASRAVHSARELARARRAGADLIFVSPIFPTASHPGARVLGPLRAMALARATTIPAIALGGMTPAHARRLRSGGFYGWSAIRWWADQKRKAVPT